MSSPVHRNTPSLAVFDGRAGPVRRVDYLRSQASASAEALISRQRHNIIGHITEQWDPRLFGHAPKPNQTTLYNLSGSPLHTDSVDAGWRLALPGLAGETLQRWDERGNHWRVAYDPQLRPVALEENGQVGVDTFTYADATADAVHNLRGQLLEQVDPSGALHFDSYGLLGEPLRQMRVFTSGPSYTTGQTFDALGTPVSQTDAGGHRQYFRRDIAGQLKQVDLQLRGHTTPQPILLDAHYNAAGQIERQDAANGVISRWTYDPTNDRLSTLKAGKPGDDLRQHLAYFYDPMGNVLRIEDQTLTTLYFANQRVDGHRDFTYDSLYRLISASGFEGATPHLQPGLPTPIVPIDPSHRFNYTQFFDYDNGNNLTQLRHVRAGNNYTQTLRVDPHSNRGVRWADGDPEPIFDALFDAHGNQLYLQRGAQPLVWNARNQLSKVTLLKRNNDLAEDDETYLYSRGERVIKTHTTLSTLRETHYLPGLELRTSSTGEELHIISCALAYGRVRCLHWEAGQPGGIEADQLRYNLDDHLGSSTLELDRHGDLISLEHYYPFGGTAWQAARSSIEVDYKTLRYSGKEMDTSGLYYYGARYYAPWLQRWVSADPAGDVDGLNRYAFVGNNPVNFIDEQGAIKVLPPTAPAQTTIQMSPSLSRVSSIDSGIVGSIDSSAQQSPPTPPPMPPKPDETWQAWTKRMALAAVDSRVGLALLPVGTSSPANAAIVSTVLSAVAQVTVYGTMFNPAWSIASTWDPEGDGLTPPSEVTQRVNRRYAMAVTAITAATALAGAILGPVVGGYVDELRGTKGKTERKTQAGKWIDTIDALIADQRLQEDVTEKAQNSLREQVMEVEELIGITWRTMGMLEKITRLRPASHSTSGALARQASVDSQASNGSRVMQRGSRSRTAIRNASTRL